MDFETERDAPIFDIKSFEIIDNLNKGEKFKILDSKESDLTKKGPSYYTRIDYKDKEYFIKLTDILKPSGKQVDFIDVNLDIKTKENVFNNFKAGHGQEKDIVKLLYDTSGKNYEFNYDGKQYEIERLGAPTFSGKGNPKTDVLVKLDKPISPYGSSKLATEAYCSCFSACYDIDAISVRFSNVYGRHSSFKDTVIALYFKAIFRKLVIVKLKSLS